MLINKIIFYNHGHNGDIHFSREFVKDIISKIKVEFDYQTHTHPNMIKDIKNLNHKLFKCNQFNNEEIVYNKEHNELYINTWIGSSNGKFLISHDSGCSLDGNYKKYKNIFDCLNIKIEEKCNYIPTIDWNCFDTNNINNFLKINSYNKICLVCNGDVKSGQSQNFNFNDLLEIIVPKYKNTLFILTDKTKKINFKNITYTQDIINSFENDLNQISYLSENVDIIIGRGSGPYCTSNTKNNFTNFKKVFIGFTYLECDAHWCDVNDCNSIVAKQKWDSSFDKNKMIDIIESELK